MSNYEDSMKRLASFESDERFTEEEQQFLKSARFHISDMNWENKNLTERLDWMDNKVAQYYINLTKLSMKMLDIESNINEWHAPASLQEAFDICKEFAKNEHPLAIALAKVMEYVDEKQEEEKKATDAFVNSLVEGIELPT